ncbi:hypothetical protein ILP97_00735 [Amycolatopsis sp. H6(2020)]|nr:hypothetical protein [Amycolatopsis sp. H6(2020)]
MDEPDELSEFLWSRSAAVAGMSAEVVLHSVADALHLDWLDRARLRALVGLGGETSPVHEERPPVSRRTEAELARWVFLDPGAREVLPDWEWVAMAVLVALRRAARARGGDSTLYPLVGELMLRSELFARWWANGGSLAIPGPTGEDGHHDAA